MSAHPLLAAIASILLSVFGQIALKLGTGHAMAAAAMNREGLPVVRLIAVSLLQPAVLLGLALYGGGAVLWLYVLARWDVSKAYPVVGFGFVLTLFIGATFLGERVTWERMAGCLLICGGLVLIVRS